MGHPHNLFLFLFVQQLHNLYTSLRDEVQYLLIRNLCLFTSDKILFHHYHLLRYECKPCLVFVITFLLLSYLRQRRIPNYHDCSYRTFFCLFDRNLEFFFSHSLSRSHLYTLLLSLLHTSVSIPFCHIGIVM